MRCYFHLESGPDAIVDDEGVEFPEVANLPILVARLVKELAAEGNFAAELMGWTINVEDDARQPLFSLCLSTNRLTLSSRSHRGQFLPLAKQIDG
jgi:hypothetical protein